jgi:hypothetical protein
LKEDNYSYIKSSGFVERYEFGSQAVAPLGNTQSKASSRLRKIRIPLLKHPSDSENRFIRRDEGAAGICREDTLLCQPMDVIGGELNSRDLRKIRDLRKAGVEIRILGQLPHVRYGVRNRKHTRARAHNQAALLIDFIEQRHLFF